MPALVKGATTLLPNNNFAPFITVLSIALAPSCATPIPALLAIKGDNPYL